MGIYLYTLLYMVVPYAFPPDITWVVCLNLSCSCMRWDRGSLSGKNCWRSEVKILRKHAQNVQVHSSSDRDCKGFTRMSMRRPYSLSYYPSPYPLNLQKKLLIWNIQINQFIKPTNGFFFFFKLMVWFVMACRKWECPICFEKLRMNIDQNKQLFHQYYPISKLCLNLSCPKIH